MNIRYFDVDDMPDEENITLMCCKEVNIPLLRKRNFALGRASYEDISLRMNKESDSVTPIAMQLDDTEDDPIKDICGGADFGLLVTTSGKVLNFSNFTMNT